MQEHIPARCENFWNNNKCLSACEIIKDDKEAVEAAAVGRAKLMPDQPPLMALLHCIVVMYPHCL